MSCVNLVNEALVSGQTAAMELHTEGPSEHGTAPGNHEPGERPLGGHEHVHGRPVSWVLVAVLVAAFIAGGLAIVNQLWWLFWVCPAVAVLSVPAGKVIGIMNDTVVAGDPARQEGQGCDVAADYGSATDPGVNVGARPPAAPQQPRGGPLARSARPAPG